MQSFKESLKRVLEFLEDHGPKRVEIVYSQTYDGAMSSIFFEKIVELYTKDYIIVPFSMFNRTLTRAELLIFLDVPRDIVGNVEGTFLILSHEKNSHHRPSENWINPHFFGLEHNTTRMIYELGLMIDKTFFSERQWLVSSVMVKTYDFGHMDLPSILSLMEDYGLYGTLFYASMFKDKAIDRAYPIFYSAFKYNDEQMLKNNYYLKNCYSHLSKILEKELKSMNRYEFGNIVVYETKYLPHYFSYLFVEQNLDNKLYLVRDYAHNIEARSLIKQGEIEIFVNLFGGFYFNPRYATLLYSKNMFNEIKELLKQRPLDMYF